MGFTEVLTLILVTLKLVGVISCGWLVVLAPELIALVFYILILILQILCVLDITKGFKKLIK